MSAKITCPKCRCCEDLKAYRIEEGAVMICPNCGAEFNIAATLKSLPDQGGMGGEEPTGEPLDDFGGFDGDMFAGDDASGGDDVGDEGDETDDDGGDDGDDDASDDDKKKKKKPAAKQDSARKPAHLGEAMVLACSSPKCNMEWLGIKDSTCPRCGAGDVMRSAKTARQLVSEAIKSVGEGLPVKRVLDRLLGQATLRR